MVLHVFPVWMELFHVDVHLHILEFTVTNFYNQQVFRIIMQNNFLFLFFSLAICSSIPCRNGATCVPFNNNANYYCQCPQEYTGSTCSTLLKTKWSNYFIRKFYLATPITTCPTDYCKNNGQCTFDYTLNRLRCACPSTFNGQYCEIPIGK
jgi:hypothetical protein